MRIGEFARRVLSSYALSDQTILWASLIGGLGTLVFVPGRDANPIAFVVLTVVAIVAQAGFAVAMVSLRSLRPDPGSAYVAFALAASGAIRGVIITFGIALAEAQPPTAGALAERTINSAIICLVGGALIGTTLDWRADFRAQYRMLLDRAMELERVQRMHEPIDREVLRAWTTMKTELDDALRQAGQTLASGASEEDLTTAAALLNAAVDMQLRPASHAMWQDANPERSPLSMRELFATTIGSWQLPLTPILGFFAVVVGFGAVVRIGPFPGLAFTLGYLALTGALLSVSTLMARRWPVHAPTIAISTAIVLPILLFCTSLLIGHAWLGAPQDALADAVIALQTPVSAVLVAMTVEAIHQRQRILDGLQARINDDVRQLLASEDRSYGDAQQLSLFVHHSVQSELSALAMQLREAALTNDEQTRQAVATGVLVRLGRLEELAPDVPPWLKLTSGFERIDDVIRAWDGILDITTQLPDATACRRDQWHVAAQVIEEALANAARHGDATQVRIEGTATAGVLSLCIGDDGSGHGMGQRPTAGIGLQWLERVAPGDWSLVQADDGSVLTVVIR